MKERKLTKKLKFEISKGNDTGNLKVEISSTYGTTTLSASEEFSKEEVLSKIVENLSSFLDEHYKELEELNKNENTKTR